MLRSLGCRSSFQAPSRAGWLARTPGPGRRPRPQQTQTKHQITQNSSKGGAHSHEGEAVVDVELLVVEVVIFSVVDAGEVETDACDVRRRVKVAVDGDWISRRRGRDEKSQRNMSPLMPSTSSQPGIGP